MPTGTLHVENVSSVCLVNSKQTFTLQLVYQSMLINTILLLFFDKKINTYFSKSASASTGLRPETSYRGFAPEPTGNLPYPRQTLDLGPLAKNFKRRTGLTNHKLKSALKCTVSSQCECPPVPNRRADGREHNGHSATIRSNERIAC